MVASAFKVVNTIGGPAVDSAAAGKTVLSGDKVLAVFASIGGPPLNTATVGYTKLTNVDKPGRILPEDTPVPDIGQRWPRGRGV